MLEVKKVVFRGLNHSFEEACDSFLNALDECFEKSKVVEGNTSYSIVFRLTILMYKHELSLLADKLREYCEYNTSLNIIKTLHITSSNDAVIVFTFK